MSSMLSLLIKDFGIPAPSLSMWNIWVTRNKFIFDGTHTQPTRHTYYYSLRFCQFHIAQRAFCSAFVLSPCPAREVCWPSGVHQDATILNVDASALSNL